MSNTSLPASWVTTVPGRYRSLADSIEGWYRRLVGDPQAIYELGQQWWDQSRRLEDVWQHFYDDRLVRTANWEGEAAESFDGKADVWVGLVSATSKSLNFAAVGLHLLSGEMPKFELAARVTIMAFLNDLNNKYRQWVVEYYRTRGRISISVLDAEVLILARRAQLVVYQQAVWLDALLASMPNRFHLGPGAKWAEDINRTNTSFDVDSRRWGLSAQLWNLANGKVALDQGIVVLNDIDGEVIVAVPFEVDVTVGTKAGLDDFPKNVSEEIRKFMTAEYDVGATVKYKYTQSYRFEDPAEAKKFLEKLTTGDRASRMREGFHARQGDGEIAPHSTSITMELEADGQVKGGLQVPVAGDKEKLQGSVGADGVGTGSITWTTLDDGQWAVTVVRQSDIRGEVEGGVSETLTGKYGAEVGYQEIITKTTLYDEESKPTKFIEQTTRTSDHLKNTETLGYSGTPYSDKGAGWRRYTGGTQSKSTSSDEYLSETAAKVLNLTEPENAKAWERRTVDPGGWRDRFETKAVQTYRIEDAQSNITARTATFESVAPIFGLFKEGRGEQVDSTLQSDLKSTMYLDSVKEPRYEKNPVFWRPNPRLPKALQDDVPEELENPDRDAPNLSDGRSYYGGFKRLP